jgi:hypothetical protein
MGTGAHCTDMLQPAVWNSGMAMNVALPMLMSHLTAPESGHGQAVVEHATLAAYSEEQVWHTSLLLLLVWGVHYVPGLVEIDA